MKGIILAGGTGSRLFPLTKVTNKHLLPVYDKPMIYYPIKTLKDAGVEDILIVSGKGHVGGFLELLGSGKDFPVNLSYEIQKEAGGIAQALSLAEKFANGEKIVVILGDNIFEDNISSYISAFESKKEGAAIFLKEVLNPSSYGVSEFAEDKLVGIIEKPLNPPSSLAVTGLYMYDNNVFDIIRTLKPSSRGELEVTDLNNFYLNKGILDYNIIKGFWGDCGESIDGLLSVAQSVKNLQARQTQKITKHEKNINSRVDCV